MRTSLTTALCVLALLPSTALADDHEDAEKTKSVAEVTFNAGDSPFTGDELDLTLPSDCSTFCTYLRGDIDPDFDFTMIGDSELSWPEVFTQSWSGRANGGAMTWKNAAAGLPHGGGKSGIRADPHTADRERLVRAFARAFACASAAFAARRGTSETQSPSTHVATAWRPVAATLAVSIAWRVGSFSMAATLRNAFAKDSVLPPTHAVASMTSVCPPTPASRPTASVIVSAIASSVTEK